MHQLKFAVTRLVHFPRTAISPRKVHGIFVRANWYDKRDFQETYQ